MKAKAKKKQAKKAPTGCAVTYRPSRSNGSVEDFDALRARVRRLQRALSDAFGLVPMTEVRRICAALEAGDTPESTALKGGGR